MYDKMYSTLDNSLNNNDYLFLDNLESNKFKKKTCRILNVY